MVPVHIQTTTKQMQILYSTETELLSLERITSEIQWEVTSHLQLWLSNQPTFPFSSEQEQQQSRNEKQSHSFEHRIFPTCCLTGTLQSDCP